MQFSSLADLYQVGIFCTKKDGDYDVSICVPSFGPPLHVFFRWPEDVKKAGKHSSANCFHQERHNQGALLLRQGVAEERVLYVIVGGSVELSRQGRMKGAPDVLATLETGQMFGTFGPELKMPFSARVISKVCEVLSAREQLGLEVAIHYVFLGLVENLQQVVCQKGLHLFLWLFCSTSCDGYECGVLVGDSDA